MRRDEQQLSDDQHRRASETIESVAWGDIDRGILLERLMRGSSELTPYGRGDDADELGHALALAIDRRRSELQLVEHRAHDKGARAVFEERDGTRWEVRATGDLFLINRL